MAKAGWKYRVIPQSAEYIIHVDSNCGRISLERNGFELFSMSDKESRALAERVLRFQADGEGNG